ncbi:mannosyltransferase [Rhodotorula diobovata]|uniref:Chitobiosyldiphosphodolichol beta-mannosyltransferase n=1 Tax=Rhodotorula diobovata TaxID=5288 RepID=A0A5C5G3J3_9BASI|nr:mannosyltransferase [Rhodotorula diobovata]
MLGLDSFVATLLGGVSLLLVLRRLRSSRPSLTPKSVALVVLGDIGRSPRMLYHATSLASNGYTTHIVAYRGSPPPDALAQDPHVRFTYLAPPAPWVSALPRPLFVLLLPLKVLAGAWALLRALVAIPVAPAFLFVQNPPAIPTLAVVKLVALARGSRVVIDWHNTGYSVLALRLGARHPVVRLAKFLELLFGRTAYAHLCVSDAMKAHLVQDAKLRGRVVTFHDRPPASFRRQTEQEAHELFLRLPALSTLSFPPSVLPRPLAHPPGTDPASRSTLFTTASGHPAAPRPALLVSSTSWTLDEDFGVLVEALELYDRAARALARSRSSSASASPADAEGTDLPRLGALRTDSTGTHRPREVPPLVVLVTGRGARRAAFEQEVERREKARWEWVRCRTGWVERGDYPRLLGSADLGVSLHTSTSGIDLPMKVVDMFGCGLPVVALEFPCIGELVQDGVNGRTFRTAEDLADRLITLLQAHPQPFPSDLDVLRAGIPEATYGGRGGGGGGAERQGQGLGEGEGEGGGARETARWGSWEDSWDRVVRPLLAP